jgi:hypothetical protein
MSVAPVGGVTGGPAPRPAPAAPPSKAAAGFERVMLAQLTKTLVDSAMGEQRGPYAALLPDTLADALTEAGGIGLAAAIDRSTRP